MSDSMQGKSWFGTAFAALLILLLLVAAAVRWRFEPVVPLGADAPAAEFSAARAMKMLGTVLGDQQPHPVDSEADSGVRQRIASILQGLGYRVDVQDTTECRKVRYGICARVRNLIAMREGSDKDSAILLSAHYDSVAAGPGASDDGSGVAVLLEIARLLKDRPAAKNSVVLLFDEGEEVGLLGAEAFAAEHPFAKHVAVALNIEARGTSGQSVMFETGDRSGWLVDAFSATSKRPLTNSLLQEAYKLMPNDTDLSVFKAKGMQGLNFAHGEQLPYYHTPNDKLEELNQGSLQQHGDNVYRLVIDLLDKDLIAGNARGSDVYTDILGLGVIHWSAAWGLGIAGSLLVAFAFAAWRLRRRYPYSIGSVIKGFASFPLVLALSGVVAYALMQVLAFFNGAFMPWHSSTLWNRVLLWSAVLLVVMPLQKLLSRNANPIGFSVGVGLPWVLMAVASAIELPGVSYLFVLPAAALVLAALLVPTIAGRIGDKAQLVLIVMPALIAYLTIIPALLLIEIMLGFNAPIGLIGMAVILGLLATFIGPVASAQPASVAHKIVAYGLPVLVLISAVLSVRAPAYTSTQPQPLNVMYLQDGAGKAFVLAGNQFQPPPASVLKAMGSVVALEPKLPWTEARQYDAAVDSIDLPPASLSLVSEKPTGEGREIVAQIHAGPALQKLMMIIPKSAALDIIEIDGRVVHYSGMPQMQAKNEVFVCQGESCDGKQIRLVLNSKEPLQGWLARITAGVPEKLKAVVQSRGLLAIPQADGDQSIVVSGISL